MSELKVNGKIVKILEAEKGTSKAGKDWVKQNFVIDTGSQYNPEVCFSVFGDEKVDMLKKYSTGQEVEVAFNVSSREFNGKYYHNLDAWKINTPTTASISQDLNSSDTDDDLPY